MKDGYGLIPRNYRLWLMTAIGILLLVGATSLQASPRRVLLLASKDLLIYQRVISTFQHHVDNSAVQTTAVMSPERLAAQPLSDYDLIIPIGTHASRYLFERQIDTAILSTFIPHRTFAILAAKLTDHPQRLRDGQLSALYLEQPFQRQLRLLRQVQPNVRRLGTVLGPSSATDQQLLERAVADNDWQLNLAYLDKTGNPIETLTPVIADSDAFLAVPDRSIFNRSTAKWILLMSFRRQIPLIAYSKRYVDAGAVAAIYSTPETVGRETAEWVNRWHQGTDLPPPAYPRHFDISINRATARSLRLKLPSKEQIIRGIETP